MQSIVHRHFKTIYQLLSTIFLVFCVLVSPAEAADVGLSPSSGSYGTGQTFTVNVQAIPNGDSINAIEGTLKFDPAILNVTSVAKGPTFSLWATEPTFSNAAGTVTFAGSSSVPFSSTANILTVTFKTVAAGFSIVSFQDTSISAADSRETNVFLDAQNGMYAIGQSAMPYATQTQEVEDDDVSEASAFTDLSEPRDISVDEIRSFSDYFTAENILIIFLVLLEILMGLYIWYTAKSHQLKEEKLAKETKDIQDQMEKIFSALRDEVYEQILHLTKRKGLSVKEKEVVESLTQALEVSEDLIEKEIRDVKSTLIQMKQGIRNFHQE